MGVGRLVIGLAWRNLRHRPWQALLLLVALSLSATAITVALIALTPARLLARRPITAQLAYE